MHVGRRIWLMVVLLLAFEPTSAAASIDDVLLQYEQVGLSAHVLVAKEESLLVDKKIGELREGIEDPQFYLGSVTKQITAAAILKLKEKGRLNLKNKIAAYLKKAPHADKISTHQLLSHSSGLTDYVEIPSFWEIAREEGRYVRPSDIIDLIRDLPLEFEPGSEWKYSNSGYALLGMIIEEITGSSYAEYLQEALFKPLNMLDSGYSPNVPPPNLAQGRHRNGSGQIEAEIYSSNKKKFFFSSFSVRDWNKSEALFQSLSN